MRKSWRLTELTVFAAVICGCAAAPAQNLGIIGVTLLQSVTTNLNGSGIRVAQPEAGLDTNVPALMWQVNPTAVGHLAIFFSYLSSGGSATTFPNSLGSESGHADGVGGNFYGLGAGVATNIAHVDNYDADYFFNSIVVALANINDPLVNQSFTFGAQPVSTQQQIDSAYDDYSSQNKTLFISAADNYGLSPSVAAPGTSYNCISVGAYQNGSSYNSLGPTVDNGRCKPDITAPASETSFSTPYVSGAAAVLMQAGLRGDGGSSTNAAADMRTLKALLLNGAVKPVDWTNVAPSPLDNRYGAGVLNIFNSYKQLAGGKHGYLAATSVTTNSPHPPTGATGSIGVLNGWDFNTNASSASADGINHYYFKVTNSLGQAPFTATATLVWNRQLNQSGINNLDLFLYDALSSNLVASSTSLVDNVQHLWLPRLPQGWYDLQVLKKGGATVSLKETYALAWGFFSQSLNIANLGTNVTLAWPLYPAGFQVEAAADLTRPAVWTTNNLPAPVIVNGSNYIFLSATNPAQFFHLSAPNL